MYRTPEGTPGCVRLDDNGRPYLTTGLVKGSCDDHFLPKTGWLDPWGWETPPRVTPAVPTPRPVSLRGLPTGTDIEGYQGACSLPTLPGFLIFGSLGAFAAGRRRRSAGAMNGLFGAWMSCALGKALGVDDHASAVLTLAGAYFAAKVSR